MVDVKITIPRNYVLRVPWFESHYIIDCCNRHIKENELMYMEEMRIKDKIMKKRCEDFDFSNAKFVVKKDRAIPRLSK